MFRHSSATFIICLFIRRYVSTGQQCWPWSVISEGMSEFLSEIRILSKILHALLFWRLLGHQSRWRCLQLLLENDFWIEDFLSAVKGVLEGLPSSKSRKLIDGWSPLAQKDNGLAKVTDWTRPGWTWDLHLKLFTSSKSVADELSIFYEADSDSSSAHSASVFLRQ